MQESPDTEDSFEEEVDVEEIRLSVVKDVPK